MHNPIITGVGHPHTSWFLNGDRANQAKTIATQTEVAPVADDLSLVIEFEHPYPFRIGGKNMDLVISSQKRLVVQ